MFNAITHEKRYRLFGASNKLSRVMRLEIDCDDTVECLDVSLGGLKSRYDDDPVCSARIWQNLQTEKKSSVVEALRFYSQHLFVLLHGN